MMRNFEKELTIFQDSLQEHSDKASFKEKATRNLVGILDLDINETQFTSIYRELIETIHKETRNYDNRVVLEEIGSVHHIGNGVANISGLSSVGVDELVTFPNGAKGLVLNLEATSIDVILLGDEQGIHGGDQVISRGERATIPVGPGLIGRVVDPLGKPLDGLPEIQALDYDLLEKPAPTIIMRSPVNEPLQTGIKIIDALFSIGLGQRELIVGNRQSGKTTIAVDTILNQKHSNVLCIYVSIGQKKSSVLTVMETLKTHAALPYCSLVIASPDDPPALRYLAPFAGCTIAEYFVSQGRNVLIIFDDLGKHADAYRELSLLLRRPPGREAYPGDIFYLHSRLLERAGKLNEQYGGGSLTAMPIVPIQQGNLASYIPTNLISICDGQIVLSTEKFNRGLKPALDIGLSVSRVGGTAQSSAMRSVSEDLKLELSQFEEVEQFTRFGTEIDPTTRKQIQRGQRLQQLLNQPNHKPFSLAEQVVILTAGVRGCLDDIDLSEVHAYERSLLHWFEVHHADIMNVIMHEKSIQKVSKAMLEAIRRFTESWNQGENR